MTNRRRGPARRCLIGASLLLLYNGVTIAAAAASGPFEGLDGVWSGNGTISLAAGTKERLRCRVQYLVREGGNNLQQALRCASASYDFQVNAYVDSKDGVLSGNWSEVTRNVSGRISGHAEAGRIQVNAGGGGRFSAKMSMLTKGTRQSVTIEPKGTDVTLVSVKLSKLK